VSPPAPPRLGELIEHWTLREDEAGLVAVKHGDSKLAFALLLRLYRGYQPHEFVGYGVEQIGYGVEQSGTGDGMASAVPSRAGVTPHP
jgi:hypothetical protein